MSYGNLSFDADGGRWLVRDLPPHVAIRFKNLFPRAAKHATEHALSDSDETRADLEWFMLRYPLATNDADRLIEGSVRVAEKMADRDKILLPTWAPGEVPGFRPGLQPYAYQAAAAKLALSFKGMLLGDEVGLGKTITAIAALTMGGPLPAAVVVQSHLAGQWARQIRKFTTLEPHIIAGRTPYDLPKADIYIFRYSNIGGWVDVLDKGIIRTAIYDEVQELRCGKSTQKGSASAVLSRHADLRLGLTATPVYNYGDEIYSVMEFIQPALLGDWTEFLREWCFGRKVKDPDALGAYLRDTGHFLRRTEDDEAVAGSMPPPNVIEWQVGYDAGRVADEAELLRRLAVTVMEGNFVEAGQAARDLDLRMRHLTGVGKARSVAAYVRLLLREVPRVLLAGWHRDVYDIWQHELADFKPVLYTGSESAAGKQRSVDAFTKGDSRVMMISLRSGIGLDGLQHNCQDVVFGELDWSPQVHHQIIGRLRRPGQPGQVIAHYLHTNEGSDPVLLEMLGVKTDQSRGINSPGQSLKARFTDDQRVKRLAQFVLDGGAA